ncbi:MAG: sensor histidine kinase [Limisphaerales bacterium]
MTQLVRPLLHALAITVLIYGLYETVERLWLTSVPMPMIHLLHIARGIVACLVVAVVVTWSILKNSPAFLAASSTADLWAGQAPLSELERTQVYASWFIAMRWIAVLVAAVLVVITVQFIGLLPPDVWWPLIGTTAVLAGCNLVYTVLVQSERGAPAVLLVQGYIDLGILTALLHFSGGIENPLSTMMVFHVIIGGVLLSRGQCYGIAAAGSVLFALLASAEYADILEHHTLLIFPHTKYGGEILHAAHQPLFAASSVLLQTGILFLTAYFVTTLAERMRYNERRLEGMAGQALADRQLLERALETTGTGLRVLDRNLQSYWANKRWNEWFAHQPASPGHGLELLDGEDSLAHQSFQDGQTHMTELTLPGCEDASASLRSVVGQRIFQVTTAPLLGVNHTISQVVQLAQDVTEQKQTQVQMIRAGQLAAVGELAGQVAHEVNNPIAIISAKASLLLSDHQNGMPVKIAQELGKILELAQRVARIAQGLLSYCRPSPRAKIIMDVRAPIRKSLSMVEQHAQTLGVAIEDHLPASLPGVRANAGELEQVFLNLFLNALDAMPKGGRLIVSVPSTPVRCPEGKSGLAISVEDTGVGIGEAIRNRIFEPFFTTKEAGRGTGLGLSICQGLVRSHGGEITVDSQPGRGTRFTVNLPVDTSASRESASHG